MNANVNVNAIDKKSLSSISLLLLFTVLGALCLFPLFAMTLASFKPSQELLRYGLNLRFDLDVMTMANYNAIFSGEGTGAKYFPWFMNSIVLAAIFTVICLFLSSLVGYGLAMYNFRGKNMLFILVLVVMMVPVEIIILPLYELMIDLRLINTIWGVILPFAAAPLPIFFFRQYASGLPKDFLDAGRVDGSSEYGIFFRIMVPLMMPAFGAMAILQSLANWNSFLWPLIVLRTNEKFTLPIGLATLLTPYGNNYETLIAGSILSIVPILILFFFFQRYFISGLTIGGVKG